MPPRHGKSLTASEIFPAWYLAKNPEKRIILASYAQSLAQRFSRNVRNLFVLASFRAIFSEALIAGDSRSIASWDIKGHRGGMISAGVGSGITGHGADLLIIDDPIKDAREANSLLIRNRIWAWYTTTAYTRLHPDGAVLVIATRWHLDDLTGRLLTYSEKAADEWAVLHFPALNDNGEALWPERYNADELLRIKASIGSYAWNALYQGNPLPAEGGMFHRSWFSIIDAVPSSGQWVRWWDRAATSLAGDYTVGVLMLASGGRYYIADVQRGQWSSDERNKIMVQTAELDAMRTGNRCIIWTEQEPGSSGVDMAKALIRLLAKFPVYAETSSGSKEVRAMPFAAQCEAGNVSLLRGDWNSAYLDEMSTFPLGTNDDQVDASSGAYNKLAVAFGFDATGTGGETANQWGMGGRST